jgi:hypothetical protein
VSSGRFTVLVVVVAVVAIVAVVVSSGGIDLPGGGDDKAEPPERAADDSPSRQRESRTDEDGVVTAAPRPRTTELGVSKPDVEKLPDNPDDVHGDDAFSLTRPANLRRALAVLERKRQKVEGVYDGLRVAPGRIDTIIIHPDDRMTNIQVRPDFEVSFETTHDFPTQADFRKDGITARDVDVAAPAKLLRAIDKLRHGSAAHDIDYFVIDRDIIDGGMNLGAYMRIRTPRPRMFTKEPGEAPRAIG